mgnify:CR=1 FL=1
MKKQSRASVFNSLQHIPQPLAAVIEKFEQDEEPFSKLRRLVDAIEVFVKLHTVVIVSHYFAHAKITQKMRGKLAGGLKTPSLGVWWGFARDFSEALEADGIPSYLEGMDTFVLNKNNRKGDLFKAMEGEDNLLSLRNDIAHGARPDDEKCTELIGSHAPVFSRLVNSASHLANARWLAHSINGHLVEASSPQILPADAADFPTGHKKGQCFLVKEGAEPLSLHPLFVCRESKESPIKESPAFFFYDKLRKNDVILLNYDRCLHPPDKPLREILLSHYPIHEWNRYVPQEFKERIEQLNETFKGRRELLQSLLDFIVQKPRGIKMLWGNPGIGKSALLARLVQILSWSPESARDGLSLKLAPSPSETAKPTSDEGASDSDDSDEDDSQELRSPPPPEEQHARTLRKIHVVEYFIYRSDEPTTQIGVFFERLKNRLENIRNTGIPLGDSLNEKSSYLKERMEKVSKSLPSDERVLLLIDGLDEAEEKEHFLAKMPRSVPDKFVLLYASRPKGSIQDLVYGNLASEHCEQETLSGLGEDGIRAFLSDYVNKYQVSDDYLSAIAERCEGNPLYLKLLCEGLAEKDYTLNDIQRLPSQIGDIYDTILKRITKAAPLAGGFLRLLAIAKEYFTRPMAVSALNHGNPASTLNADTFQADILPQCLELLVDDNSLKNPGYQLFHESLREYLLEKYPDECAALRQQLTQWCENWEQMFDKHGGLRARRFAVSNLIPLLCDSHEYALAQEEEQTAAKLDEKILNLADNPEFRKTAIRLTGNPSSIQRDLTLAQTRLLRKTPPDFAKIYQYAECYHSEPQKVYREQLQKLDENAKKNDLTQIAEIAQMGKTPDQKVLIILRALKQLDEPATQIPKELSDALNEYLEQTHTSSLNSLAEAILASRNEENESIDEGQ